MGRTSGVQTSPSIPAAKRCRVCDADVANQKRTKDRSGNYYCQPCYDTALRAASPEPSAPTKVQAVVAPVSVPPTPAPLAPSSELSTCTHCGGMFSQSAMHASGVCADCFQSRASSASPTPQTGQFKLKRIAIIASMAFGGVSISLVLIWVFVFRGIHDDVKAANDKMEAQDDRLIEGLKQKSTQLKTDRTPAHPTQRDASPRLSRNELVDGDSILYRIDSRLPEIGLRGSGSFSGDDLKQSQLRLAWMTKQISSEEYQYAQKFLRATR